MYFFPESELRTWKIIEDGIPDDIASSVDANKDESSKKSKRKRKSGEPEEEEEEEEAEWIDDEEEEEEEEEEEWVDELIGDESNDILEEEDEEDSLGADVEPAGDDKIEIKLEENAKKGTNKSQKSAPAAAKDVPKDKGAAEPVVAEKVVAEPPSAKATGKRTFEDMKGDMKVPKQDVAGAGPSTEIEVAEDGQDDEEEPLLRRPRTDGGVIGVINKAAGEVVMAAVGVAAAYLALQQVNF